MIRNISHYLNKSQLSKSVTVCLSFAVQAVRCKRGWCCVGCGDKMEDADGTPGVRIYGVYNMSGRIDHLCKHHPSIDCQTVSNSFG